MTSDPARWEVVHASLGSTSAQVRVPAGSRGAYVVLWDDQVPRAAGSITADRLPCTVAEAAAVLLEDRPVAGLPGASATGPSGAAAEEATVVVCTRGRPVHLARCLDALRALRPRPAAILVVDNSPEDSAVRTLVSALQDVDYVAEPRPGLDIARNTGWRTAGTALVAYTDDDVVVHPRWLGALADGFTTPEVVAVTGLVLPLALETEAQQVFEQHWSFNKGFAPRTFGPDFYAATRAEGAPVWEIGAGASMAFRRSFLASAGGFDERLDAGAAGCSGDSEMWYRAVATGRVCRYVPTAVAFHEHRRDGDVLRQQLRAYMRGHVAALLIQYANHGELGNLRRAFLVLPRDYARLLLQRLSGRGDPSRTATIGAEVAGAVAGALWCLRDPAWRSSVRRRARRTTCSG